MIDKEKYEGKYHKNEMRINVVKQCQPEHSNKPKMKKELITPKLQNLQNKNESKSNVNTRKSSIQFGTSQNKKDSNFNKNTNDIKKRNVSITSNIDVSDNKENKDSFIDKNKKVSSNDIKGIIEPSSIALTIIDVNDISDTFKNNSNANKKLPSDNNGKINTNKINVNSNDNLLVNCVNNDNKKTKASNASSNQKNESALPPYRKSLSRSSSTSDVHNYIISPKEIVENKKSKKTVLSNDIPGTIFRPRSKSQKPPSLRNTGANCYLNSALQGISACTLFLDEITHLQSRKSHLAMLRTFKCLIDQLTNSSTSYLEISTNQIFRHWNKPGQQDSYELLAHVINQVYNELRKDLEESGDIQKRNLDQWLRQVLPLRILMDYEIKCSCGVKTFSPIQSDLAFHVTITNSKADLQTLFNQYFDEDPIEDYQCDNKECSNNRAYRTVKLYTPLPNTICVHLQRTFWNSVTMKKISAKIDFKNALLIKGAYCKNFKDTEDSSLPGDKTYLLKSVIVHHGSVSFGHYICYILIGDLWYYTSDSSIRAVTWREVSDSEAYILFYEVKDG